MPELADVLHTTLLAAILEAGADPYDWGAENMARDILDTPSGRDLLQELENGRRAKANLVLIVARHHTSPADVQTCDVCRAAVGVAKQ